MLDPFNADFTGYSSRHHIFRCRFHVAHKAQIVRSSVEISKRLFNLKKKELNMSNFGPAI